MGEWEEREIMEAFKHMKIANILNWHLEQTFTVNIQIVQGFCFLFLHNIMHL